VTIVALPDTTLPPLRTRFLVVLFPLVVGTILGSVPGLDLCAVVWFLLAVPALGLLAFVSACQVLVELYGGRRLRAMRRGWQLALPLAGIFALPLLDQLSKFVELITVRSQLRASAWARPQEGGPHVASIQMDSFLLMAWGYAYDDSGEIDKPCGMQSDGWLRHADIAGVAYRCSMSVTHLVGPYYEWFDQ
jgi:hypothetical protein